MTSVAQAPPEIAATVAVVGGVVPYRLTVAKYEEMARHGILGPGDRVELLHGLLASKMTLHTPHTFATVRLDRIFESLCGRSWCVRSQQPVIASDDSMPEPDISVSQGALDDYLERHPTAAQTALVVEVADSSLRLDLGVKLALYAAALIPEYWVVDLPGQRLHVHTLPRGGKAPGYRSVTVLGMDEEVPLTLRGEAFGAIRVGDFLPPPPSQGVTS